MRCKKLLTLLLSGWCGCAAAGPAPCADPAYRAFDFWLGDWEVHLMDGRLAGTNGIVSEQQGCLLAENWRNAQGVGGTSMNFYDPVTEQWRQVWVSPGVIINIRGDLDDGSMVLTGYITYTAQDVQVPFRGTWTLLEDGRVRQFFEEAREPGQWKPWFEGFYSRAGNAPSVE